MTNFIAALKDTARMASAFDNIEITAKQKSDLGQLYGAKSGIVITRDKGNRVRGETVTSCSKIGARLSAHIGVNPMDKMMWIGTLSFEGEEDVEIWKMRPEVRAAIKLLGWF